jgi:hypothetical protein|tara:strand:+ start:1182 stop:1949 length:768 start_codon:yes stop_codon:yes gene_type:complete
MMQKHYRLFLGKWCTISIVALVFVGCSQDQDSIEPVLTQEEIDSQSDSIIELGDEEGTKPVVEESIDKPVSTINTNSSVEEVAQPISLVAENNLPETNLIELAQPVEELPPLPDEIQGYKTVTFDKLASFAYEVPLDPVTNKVELAKLNSQIPEVIKKFDKKAVAIRGFMLPLKVENGKVTELLIMRDQSMCCFGTVPKINEWISIKMEGDGVDPIMDQAVTLMGQLMVGEVLENEYLVGIYEMLGDKMIGPLDL